MRVLGSGIQGIHGPQGNLICTRVCEQMLEDPRKGGALEVGLRFAIRHRDGFHNSQSGNLQGVGRNSVGSSKDNGVASETKRVTG